jgi:hypothetical protein
MSTFGTKPGGFYKTSLLNIDILLCGFELALRVATMGILYVLLAIYESNHPEPYPQQ